MVAALRPTPPDLQVKPRSVDLARWPDSNLRFSPGQGVQTPVPRKVPVKLPRNDPLRASREIGLTLTFGTAYVRRLRVQLSASVKSSVSASASATSGVAEPFF